VGVSAPLGTDQVGAARAGRTERRLDGEVRDEGKLPSHGAAVCPGRSRPDCRFAGVRLRPGRHGVSRLGSGPSRCRHGGCGHAGSGHPGYGYGYGYGEYGYGGYGYGEYGYGGYGYGEYGYGGYGYGEYGHGGYGHGGHSEGGHSEDGHSEDGHDW
jgi:hypothetical protein